MGNEVGQPGGGVLTLTDIVAGAPEAIGQVPPGALIQFQITKVCWDPTCTAPAPAGAVPNMFGLQSIMSSPNNTDIGITPSPQGTIQFLNGNQITFETQVSAARMNAPNVIIPGISIGATPASRYVLNGTAYTFPFDAVSISNLNNPGAISGTAILQDLNGNNVAMGTIPAVPSGGSAGYLVVAAPGGTQGLFAANTTLPATPDGIFHGTLILSFTGQTAAGFTLVAAQEFAGNAMLNLRVFGSPVP
jgi:hypothetical protein